MVSIALAFFFTRIVWPATQRPLRGFAAYYTATALLLEGRISPLIYDDAWFNSQLQLKIQQPMHEVFSPTLPTVSWIMLPLAGLPPVTARDVWTWAMAGLFLVSLGLLLYALPQSHRQKPSLIIWSGLVSLALIFPGSAANFHEDQTIILFFFLFVLTLLGIVHGYNGLAGSALGVAFVLKTTGAALWLFFLVRRQWLSLAWGIGLMALIVIASLPWIGVETWRSYIQAVIRVSDSPIKTVTAYQTTAGFFEHLFRYDAHWNPAPLLDMPIVGQLLTLTIMASATGITLWLGLKAAPELFFSALVILSVILLPVAEEHHFVMMLIPIFILVDRLVLQAQFHQMGITNYLLLFGAIALLILPIPYESPALSVGWLALLAYPRLYGGWLLWGGIVRQMKFEAVIKYTDQREISATSKS